MKFIVYHSTIDINGQMINRYFIVLADNNQIIGWTDFTQYCGGPHSIKNIASDDKCRIDAVCRFLNYAFFYKGIAKLNCITPEVMQQYLADYGTRKLPSDSALTHRSQNTIERECAFLLDFGIALAESGAVKWKKDNLYRTRTAYSNKLRRHIEVKEPIFKVVTDSKDGSKILRDLPDVVFQFLLDYIIKNDPDMMMLVALSAFAGLRPSEACNVRRENSALGAGLQFEIVDGEVTNVIIDLTEEKVLRSDGVSVGGIKRPRTQKVYPRFLNAFVEIYNMYMKHIENRKYEVDYGPLTTARNGLAMTYSAYRYRFQSVVRAAAQQMVHDTDSHIAKWGQILQQHPIGLHIFRHWFSMMLANYGEDISGLMYWRGDKSPESALTYLQGKSDLTKQLMEVGTGVVEYQLWRAGKEHETETNTESESSI